MDIRAAIPQVLAALQILQEDPERFARERRQYSQSPPPYSSGETTQPPSPPAPLSEVDRRMKRRRERLQATPGSQFDYQWRRERERIIEQIDRRRERRKETLPYNRNLDFTQNARENVKRRWMEQGIWNSKWTTYTVGAHWKHEEDPTSSPEPSPGPESPTTMIFGKCVSKSPEMSERILVVTAEQQAAHERETAASRPYHQFVYQISKEREWLEDEMYDGVVDFDREAYKNVKNSWIKQKIWNPKWDDIPGRTWIHEEPDEEPGTSNGPMRAERDTRSRNSENGTRQLQGLSEATLLSVPARASSVNQDLQINGEAEGEGEVENGGVPATNNYQYGNCATEEQAETSLEPRRTPVDETAPGRELPSSRSMRKRKRGAQDDAGDLQECRTHDLSRHLPPPQPKRSRTDKAAHRSLPAVPTRNTKTATPCIAGSQQRSMRSRGQATVKATKRLHATSQVQDQDGRSKLMDHLGLRRSSRIQERRGTDKSTAYDEVIGASMSRYGRDARQKREGYRNRMNAGPGPRPLGESQARKGQKGFANGAARHKE